MKSTIRLVLARLSFGFLRIRWVWKQAWDFRRNPSTLPQPLRRRRRVSGGVKGLSDGGGWLESDSLDPLL
jgi:hypothetical protein